MLHKLKYLFPTIIVALFLLIGFGYKVPSVRADGGSCDCKLNVKVNAINCEIKDKELKFAIGEKVTGDNFLAVIKKECPGADAIFGNYDLKGGAMVNADNCASLDGFSLKDNTIDLNIACAFVAPIDSGGTPAGNSGLKNTYCWKGSEACKIVSAGEPCEAGWAPKNTHCGCGPNGSIIKEGDECIPLDNPLQNETTDLPTIIGIIIKAALGIIGAITLLMFVWGGTILVTSAGNPEKVKKGSGAMLWAAIGVLVVFGSYLIVNRLITFFVSSAPGANNTPASVTNGQTGGNICSCTLHVEGSHFIFGQCNVDAQSSFKIGDNITARSLLNLIPDTNCKQKNDIIDLANKLNLIPGGLDTPKVMTDDYCLSLSGGSSGYTYTIDCNLKK